MRTLLYAVFLVFFGIALPALALDVQVQVQEKGRDATDARIKAMTSAEQKAFEKLLDEKAPKKKEELLKNYNAEAISQMVQGYEIVEESMTSNSYNATMKVKFNDTAMNGLFGPGAGMKKAATSKLAANGAVLIVPVLFNQDNTVLLWETGNHWREIVGKVALQATASKWLAPLGDPNDLLIVDSEQVLKANFTSLAPLAERYGAGEVLVAIAKPADNIVAVELRHLSSKGEEKTGFTVEAPQDVVAKEADLLQQAAEKMLLGKIISTKAGPASAPEEPAEPFALTASQKSAAPPKPGLHQIQVMFYLKQARDWAEMNHRLLNIPGVENVQVFSANWHHMNGVLSYRGFPEDLGKALSAAGIDVRQEADVLMMKIR